MSEQSDATVHTKPHQRQERVKEKTSGTRYDPWGRGSDASTKPRNVAIVEPTRNLQQVQVPAPPLNQPSQRGTMPEWRDLGPGRQSGDRFLPRIFIDRLDRLSQEQLIKYLPTLMSYTNRGQSPQFGVVAQRPVWWPHDVPWKKPRIGSGPSVACLRRLIRSLYHHHGQDELLISAADQSQHSAVPAVTVNLVTHHGALNDTPTRYSHLQPLDFTGISHSVEADPRPTRREDQPQKSYKDLYVCYFCDEEFPAKTTVVQHQQTCTKRPTQLSSPRTHHHHPSQTSPSHSVTSTSSTSRPLKTKYVRQLGLVPIQKAQSIRSRVARESVDVDLDCEIISVVMPTTPLRSSTPGTPLASTSLMSQLKRKSFTSVIDSIDLTVDDKPDDIHLQGHGPVSLATIDFSSPLGMRLHKQMQMHSSPNNCINPEPFCKTPIKNKTLDKLRYRDNIFPVTYKSWGKLRRRACHQYSFTSRQRKEKYLCMKTGLSTRSRGLLKQTKQPFIMVKRLSVNEIKRWSKRSIIKPHVCLTDIRTAASIFPPETILMSRSVDELLGLRSQFYTSGIPINSSISDEVNAELVKLKLTVYRSLLKDHSLYYNSQNTTDSNSDRIPIDKGLVQRLIKSSTELHRYKSNSHNQSPKIESQTTSTSHLRSILQAPSLAEPSTSSHVLDYSTLRQMLHQKPSSGVKNDRDAFKPREHQHTSEKHASEKNASEKHASEKHASNRDNTSVIVLDDCTTESDDRTTADKQTSSDTTENWVWSSKRREEVSRRQQDYDRYSILLEESKSYRDKMKKKSFYYPVHKRKRKRHHSLDTERALKHLNIDMTEEYSVHENLGRNERKRRKRKSRFSSESRGRDIVDLDPGGPVIVEDIVDVDSDSSNEITVSQRMTQINDVDNSNGSSNEITFSQRMIQTNDESDPSSSKSATETHEKPPVIGVNPLKITSQKWKRLHKLFKSSMQNESPGQYDTDDIEFQMVSDNNIALQRHSDSNMGGRSDSNDHVAIQSDSDNDCDTTERNTFDRNVDKPLIVNQSSTDNFPIIASVCSLATNDPVGSGNMATQKPNSDGDQRTDEIARKRGRTRLHRPVSETSSADDLPKRKRGRSRTHHVTSDTSTEQIHHAISHKSSQLNQFRKRGRPRSLHVSSKTYHSDDQLQKAARPRRQLRYPSDMENQSADIEILSSDSEASGPSKIERPKTNKSVSNTSRDTIIQKSSRGNSPYKRFHHMDSERVPTSSGHKRIESEYSVVARPYNFGDVTPSTSPVRRNRTSGSEPNLSPKRVNYVALASSSGKRKHSGFENTKNSAATKIPRKRASDSGSRLSPKRFNYVDLESCNTKNTETSKLPIRQNVDSASTKNRRIDGETLEQYRVRTSITRPLVSRFLLQPQACETPTNATASNYRRATAKNVPRRKSAFHDQPISKDIPKTDHRISNAKEVWQNNHGSSRHNNQLNSKGRTDTHSNRLDGTSKGKNNVSKCPVVIRQNNDKIATTQRQNREKPKQANKHLSSHGNTTMTKLDRRMDQLRTVMNSQINHQNSAAQKSVKRRNGIDHTNSTVTIPVKPLDSSDHSDKTIGQPTHNLSSFRPINHSQSNPNTYKYNPTSNFRDLQKSLGHPSTASSNDATIDSNKQDTTGNQAYAIQINLTKGKVQCVRNAEKSHTSRPSTSTKSSLKKDWVLAGEILNSLNTEKEKSPVRPIVKTTSKHRWKSSLEVNQRRRYSDWDLVSKNDQSNDDDGNLYLNKNSTTVRELGRRSISESVPKTTKVSTKPRSSHSSSTEPGTVSPTLKRNSLSLKLNKKHGSLQEPICIDLD